MPTIGPAIQGAARQIRAARNGAAKIVEASWQDRAWEVYDRLGEVFFMTRYRRGIAAKLDYLLAVPGEGGEDPSPVEFGPLVDAFEALGGSRTIRRLVSGLMPHWDVAGEGYVVGFDSEPSWRVLSTQELRKQGGKMIRSNGDGAEIGQLDPDSVYRLWSPHPRYSDQADSPTRHVLESAEELILSSREVRARAVSRLPAGVWMIPEGLGLAADEGLETFADELVRRLARPISDPGDAGSLAPWVIEMPSELIEVASKGLISFARDFETSSDQRKELLVRLATGLDLPAEVFLGLTTANHWGGWLISEHAVSRHVAPTVDEILDSLSYAWLQPLLDDDSVILWRDLAPATVPTDRSQLTLEAHDRILISDETARAQLDFDEDAAPSPEEAADRAARKGETRTNVAIPERAITAAVERVTTHELTEIDRALLSWMILRAGDATERAIEIASERSNEQAVVAARRLLGVEDFSRFAAAAFDRIRRAQAATRRFLSRLIGSDVPDVGERDAQAAVDEIVDLLLAHAEARLFTPDASPDPLGEIGEAVIPDLRPALSIAGGGGDGLVGNGIRSETTLRQAGYTSIGYLWDYGDPGSRVTNFDPHLHLDGKGFSDFDDPVLANSATFPSADFYRPGDHRGCQCLYVRELAVVL